MPTGKKTETPEQKARHREKRRLWGLENRDKLAANQRRYYYSEKGQAKAKARTFKEGQKQAINKANWAIHTGKLVPEPCPCGKPVYAENGRRQVHAHHDDYARPLDVRWLCRSCHQKHHQNQAMFIADWEEAAE